MLIDTKKGKKRSGVRKEVLNNTFLATNPPPPSPLGAPLVAFGATKTPYSEQVTWGRVVGGQAGVTRRYAAAQAGHLRAV